MKTIYTSLPVYNKLAKQCYERGKEGGVDKPVPIKCPRHRLPSMEWNVETDDPGEITDFDLIDTAGNITDIRTYFSTTASYIQTGGGAGWANNAHPSDYDTFTSVNRDITHAQVAGSATVASCWNVLALNSVPRTLAVGEIIVIKATLTMEGGTTDYPKIALQNSGTLAMVSNIVTLASGVNYVVLEATATLATGWVIVVYNEAGETAHFNIVFDWGEKTVAPILYTALTDDYFQYKGGTLGTLLPAGIYYLKFTTANNYIYYSDWFESTCVYENLITGLTNTTFDTFTTSGVQITSAIEVAGAGQGASTGGDIPLIKGEEITVILFLTQTSGEIPSIEIYSSDEAAPVSNVAVLAIGLNEVTLTITETVDDGRFIIFTSAATNFATSEILIIREYSTKYLTINYHNDCDLGDILYADGLTQTIWFESEPMENTYPQEEEGVKNGEALFVRSFARQTKKYLVRTFEMPAFMVEVFNRMKLHDTVELIDLVGDENTVYNLEVEHEWLWDDKYYAKIELTFDYNEAFVIAGCCNNLT